MLGRLVAQFLGAARHPGAWGPPCCAAKRGLAGGAGANPRGGAGLFGIERLQRPEDFLVWSDEAITRCDALVGEVEAAPHGTRVIQLMDDISDEMCQVCDAAEACRNVHADPAWVRAAGAACAVLGARLAELNQHHGMYAKLRGAMDRYRRSREAESGECSHPEGGLMAASELAEWDAETALVGAKLQLDHEKAGVHITDAGARAALRHAMEANQHYPSAFNAALSDPRQLGSAHIPASALPPTWRALARGGRLALPLDGPNLQSFLAGCINEDARRMAYVAGHSTPRSNLQLLDGMIQCRSDMAALLGQPSYAHLKAAGATLAATPDAAAAFLRQLATDIKPLADAEAELLRRMKARDAGPAAGPTHLHAWDVDYYTSRARAAAAGRLRPDAAAPYLQLDSVLDGLSALLARSIGVELRREQLSIGSVPGGLAGWEGEGGPSSRGGRDPAADGAEAWAPGVRRLGVWDARGGGRLGTLYLDMHARPGKLPGSVLFPIRCGRRLPDGSYQQPILALVTPCGPTPERAAFTWRELRTFVHELGHAVHNMVSRTRYQHLWGTRCAQDVVEIPSHLWEHFVTDHRTASLIARHSASRDPLPAPLHGALLAAHGALPALELQQQVLLALADLAYFGTPLTLASSGPAGVRGSDGSHASSSSSSTSSSRPDTSEVWAALAAEQGSIPHVPGTCPQARFSHLTIYGASYYSYVYARALAEAVWDRHLAADPLDPEAGMEVRRTLLEPGGAVEPLELVAGVLGGSGSLQQIAGGWSPQPGALVSSITRTLGGGGGRRGGGGGGGNGAAAAAGA